MKDLIKKIEENYKTKPIKIMASGISLDDNQMVITFLSDFNRKVGISKLKREVGLDEKDYTKINTDKKFKLFISNE